MVALKAHEPYHAFINDMILFLFPAIQTVYCIKLLSHQNHGSKTIMQTAGLHPNNQGNYSGVQNN
jgi:hypothetical protein